MPRLAPDLCCRLTLALALACVLPTLRPPSARAEGRVFLQSYTPYLDERGESEIGLWLTSRTGRHDPAESVAWQWRAEWEYALRDRLTLAAYLNFVRPPGGPAGFDSPSLEAIWRLAEPGRFPGDPALYLEVTESGRELEFEPRLLLAHRGPRWIATANLIGEFAFRHDDEERLDDGNVLHREAAAEFTAGVAAYAGPRLSLGIELRGRSEYPNFGHRSAAMLSLGPSLGFGLGEARCAIGVFSQVSGTPTTDGSRDLADFERTQVRATVSFEL